LSAAEADGRNEFCGHQPQPHAYLGSATTQTAPGSRQWPQWASAAEVTGQDDRPHELVAHNDYHGHAIWHRITEAVSQLGNVTSTGALH
jgi:hypothetical protein